MSDESPAPVDLDAILADLDHGEERLPRKAIQAARENREAITPRLIQVIEEATREWQPFETPDGNGSFFALLLLAEFRVREALPVYRAALASGEEAGYDLFGDAVYEFGGQVLLSLGDDSIEVLHEFLCDERISPGVRAEFLMGFILLARDGVMSWKDAVDHLRAALLLAVEKQDSELAAFAICKLIDIGAVDALEDIEAAFRADAVDESIVDLDYVKQSLSKAEAVIPDGPRHIQDVIDLVEDWAGFQEGSDEVRWDDPADLEPDFPFADVDSDEDERVPPWTPAYSTVPIVRKSEHVGRNDPCPCGSGMKFKKCCYRRSEGDIT